MVRSQAVRFFSNLGLLVAVTATDDCPHGSPRRYAVVCSVGIAFDFDFGLACRCIESVSVRVAQSGRFAAVPDGYAQSVQSPLASVS